MIIELPPFEPTEQQPVYDYRIALSQNVYRLQIRWNTRTKSWYLRLFDSTDTVLISGVRMVIEYPLMWRHTGRKPKGGTLWLADMEDTGRECGYNDLGHRCKLFWIPEEDYPEPEPSPYTITKIEKTSGP